MIEPRQYRRDARTPILDCLHICDSPVDRGQIPGQSEIPKKMLPKKRKAASQDIKYPSSTTSDSRPSKRIVFLSRRSENDEDDEGTEVRQLRHLGHQKTKFMEAYHAYQKAKEDYDNLPTIKQELQRRARQSYIKKLKEAVPECMADDHAWLGEHADEPFCDAEPPTVDRCFRQYMDGGLGKLIFKVCYRYDNHVIEAETDDTDDPAGQFARTTILSIVDDDDEPSRGTPASQERKCKTKYVSSQLLHMACNPDVPWKDVCSACNAKAFCLALFYMRHARELLFYDEQFDVNSC